MKRMGMPLDEAYRFVKEKRPGISRNFNFLGQLLDFEKKLSRQAHDEGPPVPAPARLGSEEPARPERRFSLDFKRHGQTAAAPRSRPVNSPPRRRSASKARTRRGRPASPPISQRPQRVALGNAAGGHDCRSSSETAARFRSTAAAVRRRGRPPASHRGDSRRSWHEESNFEKTRKLSRLDGEEGAGRAGMLLCQLGAHSRVLTHARARACPLISVRACCLSVLNFARQALGPQPNKVEIQSQCQCDE